MLAISINFLKDWVQGIEGPWLYLAVFVLAFAETGTLLFFVPGEVTLIIAGNALVDWLAALLDV